MYKFCLVALALTAILSYETEAQTVIPNFCPITNLLGIGTYVMPHASCQKYYVCNWGTATEFSCPPKQEFNPITKVCGFPTGKCKPAPLKVTLTCGGKMTQNYHYPHTTECSKFYKCNFGELVEFDCPEGQHFMSKFNICGHQRPTCELLDVSKFISD